MRLPAVPQAVQHWLQSPHFQPNQAGTSFYKRKPGLAESLFTLLQQNEWNFFTLLIKSSGDKLLTFLLR
ncbi:hypothetical protein [Janthinobacterium sp. HLX7-2]|uniref:hypothetical protein n=1 Tax=Janthinobacterium sp. HLX7-2 TaxID=1259331 RepID=UPI003F25026A